MTDDSSLLFPDLRPLERPVHLLLVAGLLADGLGASSSLRWGGEYGVPAGTLVPQILNTWNVFVRSGGDRFPNAGDGEHRGSQDDRTSQAKGDPRLGRGSPLRGSAVRLNLALAGRPHVRVGHGPEARDHDEGEQDREHRARPIDREGRIRDACPGAANGSFDASFGGGRGNGAH
jgi:hypothetical protein